MRKTAATSAKRCTYCAAHAFPVNNRVIYRESCTSNAPEQPGMIARCIPESELEIDGCDPMYEILLDNGRREIAIEEELSLAKAQA